MPRRFHRISCKAAIPLGPCRKWVKSYRPIEPIARQPDVGCYCKNTDMALHGSETSLRASFKQSSFCFALPIAQFRCLLKLALSDVSLPCKAMSGLGATADIGRRYGLDGSVAFDPFATWTERNCCLATNPMKPAWHTANRRHLPPAYSATGLQLV